MEAVDAFIANWAEENNCGLPATLIAKVIGHARVCNRSSYLNLFP